MTEARQTIIISVDGQELAGTQSVIGETKRKEITEAGALGVANHTGIITLMLNGHPAVRLWLHEDRSGHAVIDVIDTTRDAKLGAVDVELYGLVPPRRGPAPKRERRFGDDYPR